MMLSPLRYRLLSSAFTSKAINTLTTHWTKCYGTATTKSASYDIVQPGKVSKSCLVPNTISKPKYVTHTHVPSYPVELLKHEADIEVFRHAGVIAFAILKYAGTLIKPGVTTDEIDAKVHEMILKQSAYPSPLHYKGFPKSICTSVNNVACHGIPDDRELVEGDIINVDITIYYKGFHADCSDTFLVGEVDVAGQVLIDITRECRDAAIARCGPGVPLSVIGDTISDIAELMNYNLAADMIGHGIGRHFHTLPNIHHCRNDEPGIMTEGMAFTIEPILSEGSGQLKLLEDGWTLTTVDHSRTAQCEHTILITNNGAEILTEIDRQSL